MVVGAFVDMGCPPVILEEALRKLSVPPVRVRVDDVVKQGISAKKVSFLFNDEGRTVRTYKDIRFLIQGSVLEDDVKEEVLRVFENLAVAEAKIHGIDKERVHFHELGSLDTICDIVSATVGRRFLGIGKVYFSSIPMGKGTINCEHGIFPNPAPATLELLKGFPMIPLPYEEEFVTPTGAALLKTWCRMDTLVPPFRVLEVGYGAGDREIQERPNVLRAVMGETVSSAEGDQVSLLETDIDDESPEVIAHVCGRLFSEGALDVSTHPIMMKKGRLGTRVTVVSSLERQDHLAEVLLCETGTLGVRILPVFRKVLRRERKRCQTSLGEVEIKVAELSNGRKKVAPEYESCARLAREHRLPLREVFERVKREAERYLTSESVGC